MTTRTFEPRQTGPIALDISGYNSNMDVTVDPGTSRARVELITDATSGPTIDTLDALTPRESGDRFEVHLPKGAESGGGVTISSNGGVVIGGNNVGMVMTGGRRGASFVSTGGGDTDMVVNGQRIQVRGGRTFVNGVEVGGRGGTAEVSDPPMPVRFKAVLPAGSSLIADTYNGDVNCSGAARVRIKTYNGDIRATGISVDSTVESYNGDVTVGSDGTGRPTVEATTYNGDVRLLDEDMRARPRTRNGRIAYPN